MSLTIEDMTQEWAEELEIWLDEECLLTIDDLEDPDMMGKVAVIDGEMVGFVIYSKLAREGTFIHHVFTLPSFRRLGIGKKLVLSMTGRVTTDVVEKDYRGYNFFSRIGFVTYSSYNISSQIVWHQMELQREKGHIDLHNRLKWVLPS